MVKLDVSPAAFVSAVKAVLPHVGKGSTLPILQNVLFRLDAGGLWLWATDRYTFASSKLVDGVDGALSESVLVSLGEVKRLAAFAKTQRVPALPLTVSDDLVALGFDSEVSVRPADGDFPRIDKLLSSFTPGPVESVGFNGDYLARFASKNILRGKHDGPLRFDFSSPNKLVRVTHGDHFVGAIMPNRLP